MSVLLGEQGILWVELNSSFKLNYNGLHWNACEVKNSFSSKELSVFSRESKPEKVRAYGLYLMHGLLLLALLQQPLRLLNSGQSKQVYASWFSIMFCFPQAACQTPQYLEHSSRIVVHKRLCSLCLNQIYSFRTTLFAIRTYRLTFHRLSLLCLPLNFCEADFFSKPSLKSRLLHISDF